MTDKRVIAIRDVGAFADNSMCKVDLSGQASMAVYRVDGQFFATQDVCSHAKASLTEGWLEGHEVFCPVHEARFDVRDGRPLCFPATEAIRTFATEVVEGQLWVDLSSERTIG